MKTEKNNVSPKRSSWTLPVKSAVKELGRSLAKPNAAKNAVFVDIQFTPFSPVELRIQKVEEASLCKQPVEPCPVPAAARSTSQNTPRIMKKHILLLAFLSLTVVAMSGCERHSEPTTPPAPTNAMPAPSTPQQSTPASPAGNESTNTNNPAPESPAPENPVK